MADILILDMELPKNVDEHITIGYNRFGKLTAAKDVWNGMDWTITEESNEVIKVNTDSFTRVIVTSGDGTVLGYKDISAREVLRLKQEEHKSETD